MVKPRLSRKLGFIFLLFRLFFSGKFEGMLTIVAAEPAERANQCLL
jgi:hypothetical protein